MLDTNPDKVIEMANDIYSLAVRSGADTEKGMAYMLRAKAYYRLNNFNDAGSNVDKAIEHLVKLKTKKTTRWQ
jgi:hypothetical protein